MGILGEFRNGMNQNSVSNSAESFYDTSKGLIEMVVSLLCTSETQEVGEGIEIQDSINNTSHCGVITCTNPIKRNKQVRFGKYVRL